MRAAYLDRRAQRPDGEAEVEVGDGQDMGRVGRPHGTADARQPLRDPTRPLLVAQLVHLCFRDDTGWAVGFRGRSGCRFRVCEAVL